LYPEKADFEDRLRYINEKTGLKIPEKLYYSLFYCIISKGNSYTRCPLTQGHLLIDVEDLGKEGINCAYLLSQVLFLVKCQFSKIVPLLVGMKCTLLNCSKMTTPEEILSKMVNLPYLSSINLMDSGAEKLNETNAGPIL
jgi:hypothetical protein